MPDYVLPQVLIFQEFAIAPAVLTDPLRACLVGEHFGLHRYTDADERAGTKAADTYNPSAEQCYGFVDLGRQAGGVVDEGYTRVFMEDALMQYYHDPIGDGSDIELVDGTRNQIRTTALVLKTANGINRSGPFKNRDVRPGDVLNIRSNSCDKITDLRTTILDLLPDINPALVRDAESDEDNQETILASVSSAYTGPDSLKNQVSVSDEDGSLYDGLEDGFPSDVYTIEVVGASSGGGAVPGLGKVTSQGGDSDDVILSFDTFLDIGSRGLKVKFGNTGSMVSGAPDQDDFLVGQIFQVSVSQAFEAPVSESGGVYKGAGDTSYIVEVTKGGKLTDDPEVTVSTTTGIDLSGPTVVTAEGVTFAIGSQGVTLKFVTAPDGLSKGDRYTVPVTEPTEGAVKTMVLSNSLPPEMRGICQVGPGSSSSAADKPELDVRFNIQADLEVPEGRVGKAPLVNWEQSETEICLQAGIEAFDPTWTDTNGDLEALPVVDGVVFIHYRERLTTHCRAVGTISDVSELPDQLGVVDPDNPLAFATFKALANANGTPVKFLGVCSNSPLDLEDWLLALEILRGREDVYSLVPLTFDKNVQDAFLAHVEAMSSAEVARWRIAFFCRELVETIDIQTTANEDAGVDPLLATITDDPDTSGTQNTLVTAAGEKFITGDIEVRPGDILRTNFVSDGFGNFTFSEFQIDAILTDDELRLLSGPAAAINVASKIEIVRNLSRNELAAETAKNPGLFNSRRVYLTYPDVVGNAGVTFEGFYLSAALAGLRSGVLPHQGLTNLEVVGFDDLTRTTEFFTESQLNTLAGSGYWIVTQDPLDGMIFTRHQLSTNNLDILRREQSITTNVDSISFTLYRRLKIFIGIGNVTPTMIDLARGETIAVLEFFRNNTTVDRLGPQLRSYFIRIFREHPLLKDRIESYIDIDVPAPLNNLEMHLIVS